MTINLTFYTTDGCHLCDEAKVFLQQLLEQRPGCYQIELVDVVESDELVEQYGTRIPVVTKDGAQQDLAWPFDYDSLLSFLEGV